MIKYFHFMTDEWRIQFIDKWQSNYLIIWYFNECYGIFVPFFSNTYLQIIGTYIKCTLYRYVPWHPSGFDSLKFQNPFLHVSHRLPSTLGLQWHRPDSRPLTKSVLESQIPSSKEPPGSQSHAASHIGYLFIYIFTVRLQYEPKIIQYNMQMVYYNNINKNFQVKRQKLDPLKKLVRRRVRRWIMGDFIK